MEYARDPMILEQKGAQSTYTPGGKVSCHGELYPITFRAILSMTTLAT